MAKYEKRHAQSNDKNIEQAQKLAKANQRPGQTKEQTKIIAQGIQKGIEQYKKQHKSKSRELSKQLKAVEKSKQHALEPEQIETVITKQHWLPWALLITSWFVFSLYVFF